MQLTPKYGLFSFACWAFKLATYSIPEYPEFSAKQTGICSNASANALIAYCSVEEIVSAQALSTKEFEISEAPPPYTILGSLIIFLTTHKAS